MEQFKTFGKSSRTNSSFIESLKKQNPGVYTLQPNGEDFFLWHNRRFIAIGYYALVDIEKVQPKKSPFIEVMEWRDIDDLPPLILDYKEMVYEALQVLQNHFHEKLIAFNLLPETFTMRQLQEVYETISGKIFLRGNFQKMILSLDILERLEKLYTGAKNKAPYLYRLKK